jgi:hypothetical protein
MPNSIETITRFEHAFRASDQATIDELNFYRLNDGRVTDIWTQFDGVGMIQQLGAIPA